MYQLDDVANLASGIDHSEGICVGLDGNLYLGGELGQIYRLTFDGVLTELMRLPAGGLLLGLATCADGNLLVCDPHNKCVWRVDLEKQTWNVFCDSADKLPLSTPNWGCFIPDGSFLFTDSGGWKESDGRIIRVLPNGDSFIWNTECRNFPNGMALSEDGSGVYVLESTPGRLVYIPIDAVGSAGGIEVLCDIPGVPDGVTVAEGGILIISCYRPDRIYIWSKTSGLQLLIEDPEGTVVAAPTNTVLTGENRNLLIWPNFGRWNVAKLATEFTGVSPLIL